MGHTPDLEHSDLPSDFTADERIYAGLVKQALSTPTAPQAATHRVMEAIGHEPGPRTWRNVVMDHRWACGGATAACALDAWSVFVALPSQTTYAQAIKLLQKARSLKYETLDIPAKAFGVLLLSSFVLPICFGFRCSSFGFLIWSEELTE